MAKNNFMKLVTAWAGGWQKIQNALVQLLTLRSINTATGAQLDLIGKMVTQPRNGDADEDYRRKCRARIAVLKSKGAPLDFFKVCKLIVTEVGPRFVYRNEGNGCVIIQVADYPLPDNIANILISFLRETVSAGVRLILESSASAADATFGFYESDGLGWGTLPELDLAPLTANVETVVWSRDHRPRTLAIVLDGTGAGSLTNAGDAWTFHAESGVTTVANFETAINASTDLVVKTTDGAGTFAAGDAMAATSFTASPVGGALSSAKE